MIDPQAGGYLPTLLAHLQADLTAFEQSLGADLSAPVPACPGWDAAELAIHLGRTHRWATAALTSTDQPSYPPRPGPAALRGWFGEGAAMLVTELQGRDADQPCWTFWPPHRVAFWVRRQAHETAVHRWDLQSALGVPARLADDLARDGIAEVLEVMYPRQVAVGRQEPVAGGLLLHADPDEWLVGSGPPGAVLTSDAESLLLLLWKRRTLEDVLAAGGHLDGDRAVADAVLGAHLTP